MCTGSLSTAPEYGSEDQRGPMAHSRGRNPRNRSRTTRKQERPRRARTAQHTLSFGPGDLEVVRRGVEAEARGDATTALELHLAGPHLTGSLRESRLRELLQLGSDVSPWMVSRWIVAQVLRRLLVEDIEPGRRALVTTGETAYRGVDHLRPMGKDPRQFAGDVAGGDWVCAQLATYEYGGLSDFLGEAADPRLIDRADRIEEWADAELGGYRLDDVIDDRLLITDLRDGRSREVLNIGSSWGRQADEHVLGRLVPVGVGPGLMFESRPLFVDETTAQGVAWGPRVEDADWTAALVQARVEGRLPLGFSALQPTSFLTDLPHGGPAGLRAGDGSESDPRTAAVALADLVLDEVSGNPALASHMAVLLVSALIDDNLRAAIVERCTQPRREAGWRALAEALAGAGARTRSRPRRGSRSQEDRRQGNECGIDATFCHMDRVASRDLRNHTADVLRRVSEGGRVAVTVHGKVVAEVVPPTDQRPGYLTRAAMVSLLEAHLADPGLTDDLRALGVGTTDDLGPIG